jgi:hypothetical protein
MNLTQAVNLSGMLSNKVLVTMPMTITDKKIAVFSESIIFSTYNFVEVKRRHKNSVKKFQPSHGDSTNFTVKELLPYGAALAVYLIYLNTNNSIVKYPDLIAWLVYGVAFAITLAYQLILFRKIAKSIDKLVEKIIAVALRVLIAAVFSIFITGILLIPFNYYDIYASRGNPSETVICPLRGVVSSRNHSIYYDFGGSLHALTTTPGNSLMNEIYSKGNYKEYQLLLTVRKAFLGSYIIEDWQLDKR